MDQDIREAILLFSAVCLHFDTGSGLCVDLDVTGRRTNPQFCQDPLLAEVTCPISPRKLLEYTVDFTFGGMFAFNEFSGFSRTMYTSTSDHAPPTAQLAAGTF
ncbi:hypothetical protein MAR_002725 [Mya arenaria]|uniref:Uncharacterized protein n=1 Tax=Mya arenaria TaxID=6604 RepID=A0ABY7G771_MYAAR|nr:hypothetical protein MAR_002725 [Mya arenaria]